MHTTELRQLTPAELVSHRDSLRSEMLAVREAIRTGKEKNHAKLKQFRRDVARVETVLRQAPANATLDQK